MVNLADIKEQLENAVIAFATVTSQSKPHNIAIMYAKVKDNQVVITDNYMGSTIENVKQNSAVSLVFWEGEDGWRIDGDALYFDSGEWLNYVKSLEENEGLPAKGAIVIKVNSISELG